MNGSRLTTAMAALGAVRTSTDARQLEQAIVAARELLQSPNAPAELVDLFQTVQARLALMNAAPDTLGVTAEATVRAFAGTSRKAFECLPGVEINERPPFAAGQTFDLEVVSRAEGLVSRRDCLDGTTAFVTEKRTYFVWSGGPKAGQVYTLATACEPARLAAMPPLEGFEARARRLLIEFELPDPSQWTSRVEALASDLQRAFSGVDGQLGYRQARYVGPGELGERLNATCSLLEQRAGFSAWLMQLAAEQQLPDVAKILGSRAAIRPRGVKAFFAAAASDPAGESPRLRLLHRTELVALPGIVQLGALASVNELKRQGIGKRTGENPWGGGYTPNDVSFTEYVSQRISPSTYGTGDVASLPLAFGLTAQAAQALALRDGTMDSEKTAKGTVPLSAVTHVFVAPFCVNEVKSVLEAHGFSHLTVLPFGAP
jgi:hypothetical protein